MGRGTRAAKRRPIGTGHSGSLGDITWHYEYFLPELKGVARERQLEVSVTVHGDGLGAARRQPGCVARALRLAKLINGFAIVQPGSSSCTQPGPQAEIKLTFRRHVDMRPLAEVRFPWPMSNCDFLELKIRPKRQPGLEEAWILHRHLRPILDRMAKQRAG